MTWPLLALTSIFTLSVATLLERVLMKDEKSSPIGYAIIFQFGLGTMALIFALLFHKFVFPNVGVLWPRLVLSACLWAGSTVFSFKAIQKIGAGEMTILSTSSVLVSIVLSVLFLGEGLTTTTIIGTALVLLAIWILNADKLSLQSREGVGFALLCAAFAGTAVVNDAFILRTYESFSYVTIMSFLPGVVLLLTFPKHLAKAKSLLQPKTAKTMGILVFFYAIQAITYYLAFQSGAPISQLSPLTHASIIVTVILSAIFLHEHNHLKKKFLAAAVVTIGAILLS